MLLGRTRPRRRWCGSWRRCCRCRRRWPRHARARSRAACSAADVPARSGRRRSRPGPRGSPAGGGGRRGPGRRSGRSARRADRQADERERVGLQDHDRPAPCRARRRSAHPGVVRAEVGRPAGGGAAAVAVGDGVRDEDRDPALRRWPRRRDRADAGVMVAGGLSANQPPAAGRRSGSMTRPRSRRGLAATQRAPGSRGRGRGGWTVVGRGLRGPGLAFARGDGDVRAPSPSGEAGTEGRRPVRTPRCTRAASPGLGRAADEPAAGLVGAAAAVERGEHPGRGADGDHHGGRGDHHGRGAMARLRAARRGGQPLGT